jgi:hypothetical protein
VDRLYNLVVLQWKKSVLFPLYVWGGSRCCSCLGDLILLLISPSPVFSCAQIFLFMLGFSTASLIRYKKNINVSKYQIHITILWYGCVTSVKYQCNLAYRRAGSSARFRIVRLPVSCCLKFQNHLVVKAPASADWLEHRQDLFCFHIFASSVPRFRLQFLSPARDFDSRSCVRFRSLEFASVSCSGAVARTSQAPGEGRALPG